jgi:NAD(P)-dependent dehydrogenase (short-subunit alcohol dehydrogenase family)
MTAALITGGARRLGRAMALALAADGYDVVIHYAGSAEDAEATANEARALGVKAATIEADLLDAAATAGLVDAAAASIGGALSVLINNASIFEYDNFETATLESWDRHINSNLRAPFMLSQQFAQQARAAKTDAQGEPVASALIVNMIDQRVRKLTPEFATYTIAKFGLWGMTQTAAQALAPNIRVNAIGPGPTMQGARQSAEHFAAQRAATILERGASPQEITAALRYFLMSPGVTGQLLCVDGGQHLGWKTPDVLGPE